MYASVPSPIYHLSPQQQKLKLKTEYESSFVALPGCSLNIITVLALLLILEDLYTVISWKEYLNSFKAANIKKSLQKPFDVKKSL